MKVALMLLYLTCAPALRDWHRRMQTGVSISRSRYSSRLIRASSSCTISRYVHDEEGVGTISESMDCTRDCGKQARRSAEAFSSVLQALKIYKDAHNGSMQVPSTYRIPSEPKIWPANLWGLPLGRRVVEIRCLKAHKSEKCRESLDKLGFVWNPSRERTLRTLECMRIYILKYPNTSLPPSFVIPKDEADWPAHSAGYRLGAAVRRLRLKAEKGMLPESYISEFEELNKLLECSSGSDGSGWMKKISCDEMVKAVRIYEEEYGHVSVPSGFRVPTEEPWPQRLWGLRLGSRLADIKRGKSGSEELRSVLRVLGIKPAHEVNSMLRFEGGSFSLVVKALRVYKEIYGDLRVPSSFRIPSEISGTAWSGVGKDAAGLRLGVRVNAIRAASTERRLSPRVRGTLNALGFIWRVSDYSYHIFVTALERFREIYGHIEIPPDFIIPREDVQAGENLWPNITWGYRLGAQFRKLKRGALFTENQKMAMKKSFPELHTTADTYCTVGLANKSLTGTAAPFDLFYKSLRAFKDLHGHTNVPAGFVVPMVTESLSSQDWPHECSGYKLGSVCSKVRRLRGVDFLLLSSSPASRVGNDECVVVGEEYAQVDLQTVLDHRRASAMEMLATLSFSFLSPKELKFERICKALLAHQRLFGDMDVPRYYTVPAVDDDWPPECLGMRLGLRVRDLKAGLAYKESKYRNVLRDIGFFSANSNLNDQSQ